MSILEWLFGKKESAVETFAKAIPYELGLEKAVVSYDPAKDASNVLGDATDRAWTFSSPTRVRVACEKTRPISICLYHTDNPGLTFFLEAKASPSDSAFDLAVSPRAAVASLARGTSLHLGRGIVCSVADLDAIFELSGDLLETYFPRFANGSVQALRVTETETEMIYGPALPEGLVHKDLYDDSRLLLKLLELRRRTAAGDRPFRPDETGAGFAEKLSIVAATNGSSANIDVANPKKRVVSFHAGGVPARAILKGKNSEPVLQLELDIGERAGAFKIHHDHQERDDQKVKAQAWSDSEMRVFFAKNAFVSSTQTRAEVQFLLALPESDRTTLIALCTHYDCEVTFADGMLSIDFRELAQFLFYVDKGRSIDAAEELVAIATRLARIAHAFPGEGPKATARAKVSDLPELTGCKFCRALFFRAPGTTSCIHCGAPAATAFHVASLQDQAS